MIMMIESWGGPAVGRQTDRRTTEQILLQRENNGNLQPSAHSLHQRAAN